MAPQRASTANAMVLQRPLVDRRSSPKRSRTSSGSISPGSPRQPSKDPLPDLRERLIEYGIYQQYLTWSEGYQRWRQGSGKGARGEPTVTQLSEQFDNVAFKYWYPDEVSIRFRETVAYWIAVLFIEGSILFACCPVFAVLGFPDRLSARVTLIGSTLYTLGCYLIFFEVVNLSIKDGEALNFLWCNWAVLREKYELQYFTIVGGVSYFIGALLYQIIAFGAFMPNSLDPAWNPLTIPVMSIVAGICFVTGGICEVVANRVWERCPDTLVWWVSVVNFLGDVCFLIDAVPSLSEFSADLAEFVGAVLFLIGGALSLGMWKNEQFGLALLGQLNSVARSQGTVLRQSLLDGSLAIPEEAAGELQPKRISPRGIFHIIVCSITGALSCINCSFQGLQIHAAGLRDKNIAMQEGINLVIVHLVLILHSAGLHRVPKEQPYRFIVFSMRIVMLLMMVHGIITVVVFLRESRLPPLV